MNLKEPAPGETWTQRRRGTTRQTEYIIITMANHTQRIEGSKAERLVIYRAAYGQQADPQQVWADPINGFLDGMVLEPNPKHVEDAA